MGSVNICVLSTNVVRRITSDGESEPRVVQHTLFGGPCPPENASYPLLARDFLFTTVSPDPVLVPNRLCAVLYPVFGR